MIGEFYWTKLDNILATFLHVECRTKNNRFFSFCSLSLLRAITPVLRKLQFIWYFGTYFGTYIGHEL
jgi:hypothetical protein